MYNNILFWFTFSWLYFSSSGNQVHISHSTYMLLKKFKVFDMRKRGSVSVKVCNEFKFFHIICIIRNYIWNRSILLKTKFKEITVNSNNIQNNSVTINGIRRFGGDFNIHVCTIIVSYKIWFCTKLLWHKNPWMMTYWKSK